MIVMIDEGYDVTRFKNMQEIVDFCENSLFTSTGQTVTKSYVSQELKKFSSFNVYELDEDELEDLKDSDSKIRKDWTYKFQKI